MPTPFKVEYARTSRSRDDAPTLIPYENGKEVSAVILVLKDTIDITYAKSILWRREIHKVGENIKYIERTLPTSNQVQIITIKDFKNIDTVLYTSIAKNIDGIIDANRLSDFAIQSILKPAGESGKDGLRYLLDAKMNGIVTTLSKEYEEIILKKTNTKTLEQAIIKFDQKRSQENT